MSDETNTDSATNNIFTVVQHYNLWVWSKNTLLDIQVSITLLYGYVRIRYIM